MRSSSQTYLSNLDHLRAFAAFMVFIWHFTHYSTACPNMQCQGLYHIYTPFFSLLEQGYSGVALFMCISGYIFTYLTHGKRIHIVKFWFNRILRLLPLVIFWGVSESLALIDQFMAAKENSMELFTQLVTKILHPQGSWTIYIELQYYLALPVILFGVRKYGAKVLLWFLIALIGHRFLQWYLTGSVQYLSYWTIWGHADQFILGAAAFHLEQWLKISRPDHTQILKRLGISGFAGIMLLYEYVQFQGGLYEYGDHPSTDFFWVVLPTIEAACYSLMIIAYLQLRIPKRLDQPLSALGRWSYSIYLNHFQLLPFLIIYANTRFLMGAGFYNKLAIATLIIFPLLTLFSAATYGLIEKPFLRLRKNYLLPEPQKS